MNLDAPQAVNHLLELGAGPLSLVLKKLSVPDICSAAQTCRALRCAAQDDSVWQAKALERYPPESVRLERYCSYKELVRDDNAEHAALLLCFTDGRSCRYKFNNPAVVAGYYECLLLALEWHRAEHTFRLYFEARGEADLRQPADSSLGFMVHRPPPPDRRALEARLRQLHERRQQLQAELAAAVAADAVAAIFAAQREMSRNSTQQAAVELELGHVAELRFADLLTVVRPAGQQLVEDRPGHKLGCLAFDSLHRVETLVQELPDSYASKQQALQRGIDLAFTFANPIPVMPHYGAIVDYESAIIATLLPGTCLLDFFRRQGAYCLPGQLLAELAGEGPEERAARWEHVPAGVRVRQPPWMV